MSGLIDYNEYLHITIIVAGILHVAGTPPDPTAAQSSISWGNFNGHALMPWLSFSSATSSNPNKGRSAFHLCC